MGKCLKSGDSSLKVRQHPKYGKILTAARQLPKHYYVAWWGTVVPSSKLPKEKEEWALRTPVGMIDATSHKGSQLLFCACPGPAERPTVNFAPNQAALLAKKTPLCGVIFRTLHSIPRNHQLTMMYDEDAKTTDQFFKERGIVRANVGTARFPALRRSDAR